MDGTWYVTKRVGDKSYNDYEISSYMDAINFRGCFRGNKSCHGPLDGFLRKMNKERVLTPRVLVFRNSESQLVQCHYNV